MDVFTVKIEGYWREPRRKGLPTHSGIYFVYDTKYNSDTDTVSLQKVIYVGEADNIKERIDLHGLYETWRRWVQAGNELSFSAAYIEPLHRTRIKAAFIFQLKPPANTVYIDHFPYPPTRIAVSGKTRLLETNFEVL